MIRICLFFIASLLLQAFLSLCASGVSRPGQPNLRTRNPRKPCCKTNSLHTNTRTKNLKESLAKALSSSRCCDYYFFHTRLCPHFCIPPLISTHQALYYELSTTYFYFQIAARRPLLTNRLDITLTAVAVGTPIFRWVRVHIPITSTSSRPKTASDQERGLQ
jgi:hypothetical protein